MIKLGVVGHGRRVSSVINDCFRPLAPDLRVAAIVDPDREGALARLPEEDRRNVACYETLPEMVKKENLDALAIGTRCHQHTFYASQAAQYDLPLFLEKPVAINMEQALSLEKAYNNSRCVTVVSFPLRVSPLCELAREQIIEGTVGKPEHILGVNYVPYGTTYWDDLYRFYDMTQGLFIQKTTHDFDYMMFLMGEPIVRVAAMQTRGHIFGGKKPAGLRCSACPEQETCLESPQNRRHNLSGGTYEDHWCSFGEDCGTPETGMNEDSSSAVFEFASGAHGSYTQVFYSRRDSATRGATVSGYHGTVSFDWYTNKMHVVRHHRPFSDWSEGDAGQSHFGGDAELGRDFIDLIKKGKKPRAGIREGLQSIYACLAAKESADKGCFMDVKQVEVDLP